MPPLLLNSSMRYMELLTEAPVEAISPQQAVDRSMFGPLYHGTRADLGEIVRQGFEAERSIPLDLVSAFNLPLGTSNGFALEPYGFTGTSAPVHFLGFGTYFTTVKAIAKQFSGGSMKGQRSFYLDSKNVLEINFGSPNTMMRWWRENGFDMTFEETKKRDVRAWKRATMNLTKTLASKYDAVWYKGKGIRKLLDGDQVCVYAHALDKLRVVDPKLTSGTEIGAKVTHTQTGLDRYRGSNVFYVDDLRPTDFGKASQLAAQGWRGVFRGDEDEDETTKKLGRSPLHYIPPPNVVGTITRTQHDMSGGANPYYSVKWSPGGEMFNYRPEELQPYTKKVHSR